VTQVGEHIWLVTFMHYDLRYFDDVGPESVTYPLGMKCYPSAQNWPLKDGSVHWTISATGSSVKGR